MDNNYLKRKDLQSNGCDCRVWLMKHTVTGKARQMIAGERHTPAKDSTSKLSRFQTTTTTNASFNPSITIL